MFVVEGKVVLITGAVGGIGRSYVTALLKQKVKGIALLDIDEKGGEEFQEQLATEFGPNKTVFINVDITDSKQLEDAFRRTVDHFKQLDIVINNAGIIDERNVEKCLKVNLIATVISTNLAFDQYLPKYKSGSEAVVVNTASIAGLMTVDFIPAYTISKHGIVTLGNCLGTQRHYDRNNIKILTICPGLTDTPILGGFETLPEHLTKMTNKSPTLNNSKQHASVLGDALISVLENGDTGSIWIVAHGKEPRKVDYDYVQNYFVNLITT